MDSLHSLTIYHRTKHILVEYSVILLPVHLAISPLCYHSYVPPPNTQKYILPGPLSRHTLCYLITIAYWAIHSHCTLLRTIRGNRNQSRKQLPNSYKTRYEYLELQSSYIQVARYQNENAINN